MLGDHVAPNIRKQKRGQWVTSLTKIRLRTPPPGPLIGGLGFIFVGGSLLTAIVNSPSAMLRWFHLPLELWQWQDRASWSRRATQK